MSERTIKHGDTVTLHYTGTFTDGEVFDTTDGAEPHQFQAGAGTVIKGFDEAILGMKVEEEKEVTMAPNMAYGDYNENLVENVPRNIFEDGMDDPEVGIVVGVNTKDGHVIPATVKSIGEESVQLDFNHPLAGKTLKFKIKVVDISDKPISDCGCGCGHDHGPDPQSGGTCC